MRASIASAPIATTAVTAGAVAAPISHASITSRSRLLRDHSSVSRSIETCMGLNRETKHRNYADRNNSEGHSVNSEWYALTPSLAYTLSQPQ
jgi:hypothetical protein